MLDHGKFYFILSFLKVFFFFFQNIFITFYNSRQPILEIMSTFAVLTNSALIAFTGTFAINTPWYGRAWIFFSMSFAIIG